MIGNRIDDSKFMDVLNKVLHDLALNAGKIFPFISIRVNIFAEDRIYFNRMTDIAEYCRAYVGKQE
jgi:hypothetical protein